MTQMNLSKKQRQIHREHTCCGQGWWGWGWRRGTGIWGFADTNHHNKKVLPISSDCKFHMTIGNCSPYLVIN